MDLTTVSAWCSIAGLGFGLMGFCIALWAWWSSNRTAARAQLSLNAVGDGLEALSRGLTVVFSRDEKGNIFAQVVTGKLTLAAGEASIAFGATASPPTSHPRRPWWRFRR
jgi:hypothetical protein